MAVLWSDIDCPRRDISMFRFLILLVLFGLFATVAHAEKRIALLVGNQNYTANVGRLKNPHSDVIVVGDALKALGFKVTIRVDLDYRTLDAEIKRYIASLRREGPGVVSFFYYSGHGAADPDTKINYLIPVDVVNANDEDLWNYSLNLNTIVEGLRTQSPNATHYVVFDACRNELNLTRKGHKALTGKGFEPLAYAPGVMVAYATAPGRTAADLGDGPGPYARALAEELLRPGVEAVTMFRRVALRVNREIGQDPWISASTIPEVYFAGDATPSKTETSQATHSQPSEVERAWALIKDSKDSRDFAAFRRQYGKANPFYDEQAERRIDELNKTAAIAKAQAETEAKRRREEELAAEKKASEEAKQHAEEVAAKRKAEREALAREQAEGEAKRKREQDENRRTAPSEAERTWATVKDTTDQSVLEAYIRQFSSTVYGAMARARIAELRKKAAEQAQAETKLKKEQVAAAKAQAEAEERRRREEAVAAERRAALEAKQRDDEAAAKIRAEKEAMAIQDCNQQQDNDRRIEGCTELVRQNANNAVAYNNRGIAHILKKEYSPAIADFTKAIEINPKWAGAFYNRGNAKSHMNEYDLAIADYTRAIDIDPQMAAAYSNRGNAHGRKKDYYAAITDFNKAIAMDSKHLHAYVGRGFAYASLSRRDEAIADFRSALSID